MFLQIRSSCCPYLVPLLVLLVWASFSTSSEAQVGDTTSTPIAGSGHPYIQDLNEIVDPEIGSLSIRVAAPVPNERGINLPVYPFSYDSNAQPAPAPDWEILSNGQSFLTQVNLSPISNLGPPNSVTAESHNIYTENAACIYYTSYVYTDPTGGRHPLNTLKGVNNAANNSCPQLGISYSADGQTAADAQYVGVTSTLGTTVTVYDNSGNVMANQQVALTPAPFVEDTNGNYLHPSGRLYSQSGGATNVPGVSGSYALNYSIPYSDVFSQKPLGTTSPFPFNITPVSGNTPGCPTEFGGTVGGYSGTSYLALPNGQQYTFTVDPTFGLINHISYPTGSSVDYTWAMNPQSEALFPVPPVPGNASCSYLYDWPAIHTRVLSLNGVRTQEQDFSYNTTWTLGSGLQPTTFQRTTTVITKDLLTAGTPSYKTVYTFTGEFGYYDQPISVATYDIAGNLLVTSYKVWNYGYQQGSITIPSLLAAECTTVNGANLTSGTFYQYSGNIVVDKAEYDYGLVSANCVRPTTGSPSRETKTTLQAFSGNAMIANRPQSVQIFGNGVLLAETDYNYDEYSTYPLVPVPGVTGHDTAFNSSSSLPRGNATTTTQRCFVGATGTCLNSVTHAQYDETGQVVTSIDGKANPTYYSYADAYTNDNGSPASGANTNTYLTKVTRPPTNGATHVTSYTYGFNDGKLRTSSDENQQVTRYCYWTTGCSGTLFDTWYRLRQTQLPDGGGTTTNYIDGSPTATITSSTLATPNPNIVTQSTYDSMGRLTSNIVTSAGNIKTDTVYNGFGQVASISNPYISTADLTYGTTKFNYDSLGRPTIETQPDGFVRQWCYNNIASSGQTNCMARMGNKTSTAWIDISDEDGNHSQNDFDGLGRLVAVLEPNPANKPAWETDYQYDGLNNLTQVDQWGGAVGSTGDHQRLFHYDSLSRLVASSNPESGVTCYGTTGSPNQAPTLTNCTEAYDANGNLTAKTDARGITTSLTYDALNRLTSKQASGINYSYWFDKDPNSSVTATYPVGRMTYQSNGVNADRHYSYDAVGRTVLEEGTSPTNAGTTTDQVSATYDLAGQVYSMTYPDGLQIAQTYDGAGHLQSIKKGGFHSALGQQSFFTASTYDPAGNPAAWSMGNGVAVAEARDTRFRPGSLTYTYTPNLSTQVPQSTSPQATTSSSTTQTLWSKQYGWAPNGNLQLATDNVLGVARQYTYDSLNRLTTAQDIAGSVASTGETSNTGSSDQDNALATPQYIDGSLWGMVNSSIMLSNAVAPDGSMTALTMTANAGSTNSYIDALSPTPSLFDGATATAKVWLKVPTGTLTTSIWVIDSNSAFAGIGQTVTLNTSWQQFTISNVVFKNGLVTLALQIGSNNTITSGQTVNVWGAELNVSNAPDTNILPSSQQVGAAGWTIFNGTVQANVLVAPDGSNTASTVTPASGTPDTYLRDFVTSPAQFSGTTVTGSVYLKVSSGTPTITLSVANVGSSGNTSSTSIPVTLSTTWQRFPVTATTQAGLSQLFLQIGGSGTLTGSQTIGVWGAQMVVGSTDGTYVATSDTTTSPIGTTEYLAANGLNETFSYDPFGNLQQSGNLTFEQSFTTANQLSGWSYDAAGNLLSDGLGNFYTYDANGMISSDGSTSYYYDATGNRVGKSGASPTDTIYFGGKPIARLTGGTWTDLIYGPSGLLAENTSGSAASPIYRMTDLLGSSVGTLSAAAAVLSTHDYAPFGQTFAGGGADPYQFTGKERDAESGLDYFGARYYSSNMGRFSSPDPSGLAYADITNPQSFNLYSYALNNPLRLVDPSGLSPCDFGPSDTHDGNDFEQTDNDQECIDSGGTPIDSSETVNVRPDNSGDDTLSLVSSTSSAVIQYQTFAPSKPCVKPTALQRAGIAVQSAIASATGKTIGIGISGSAGGGLGGAGIIVSGSAQMFVQPNGDAALVYSFIPPSAGYISPGPGLNGQGAGANIGFIASVSSQPIGGTNSSFSIDGSYQNVGASINTSGGSLTLGVGVGAKVSAGVNLNFNIVVPVCR